MDGEKERICFFVEVVDGGMHGKSMVVLVEISG